MLHPKLAQIIKTPMLCCITLFRKTFCLWDSVEKYCTAGRPQMTIKYNTCALHAVNLRLQNALRIFNIYYLLTATIVTQTPEFYVISTLMLSAWLKFVDGGDRKYFELNSIKHSHLLSSCALWMWTWHFLTDRNIWTSRVILVHV
jgi:hypothetical protein